MSLQGAFSHIIKLVPKPIVQRVSRRYIAGERIDDALRKVRELNRASICGTVDVLGEFVERREQAVAAAEIQVRVIDAIERSGVDSNVSIKLTSLGLKIDFDFCCARVKELLAKADAAKNFVRIDMEDSSCTTPTLDVYQRMRAEGFTNVGVVLQACLRRTATDVEALPARGLNVRLCKGIYIEPESIALRDRRDVQDNFKQLLRRLLDKGAYVGIATHDDVLIDDASELVRGRGLGRDAYQFQMLLGVREEKRSQIVRDGHAMRVYVPFGEDWYGYAIRRLQENPQIAMYIARAMFSRSG